MARTEKSFSMTGADGRRRRYRILDEITIDDCMVIGARAVIGEIALGFTYESPFSRSVRDHLVLTHITTRG